MASVWFARKDSVKAPVLFIINIFHFTYFVLNSKENWKNDFISPFDTHTPSPFASTQNARETFSSREDPHSADENLFSGFSPHTGNIL